MDLDWILMDLDWILMVPRRGFGAVKSVTFRKVTVLMFFGGSLRTHWSQVGTHLLF